MNSSVSVGLEYMIERFWKAEMQKFKHNLIGGIPTPLKNMEVRLDDSSQYMETYKMFQTTNQIIESKQQKKVRVQDDIPAGQDHNPVWPMCSDGF